MTALESVTTNAQAKVWPAGASEPGAWTIETLGVADGRGVPLAAGVYFLRIADSG